MEYLLEHHYELFSDVQKLVAIYAKDDNGVLKSVVKSSSHSNALNISDFKSEINKFRKISTPFSWYDESSLPFRIRQAGIFQQELFDELDKTVLLIRMPSEYDGKQDLLFIYFDKNLSNLAVSLNSETKLLGDTKSLVAKLLYKSVKSVISDAYENQQILKHNFNPGTQSIIQSHKQLKSDYINLQSKFNNTFLKLVKSIFYKYLDKDTCSITLTDISIQKLIAYNGNFDELEMVIKNTVSYISTLYLGELPENLAIEEYFINTDLIQQSKTSQQENNRYTKTIHLLDNLNEAVKAVMEQHQNPTGQMVGQAMPKPISAPAISDAIKNHRNKILSLLENYPNRWTELKQYFKPIQNLRVNQPYQNKIAN